MDTQIELAVTLGTPQALEEVDLNDFDAFYLGNPFCLKLRNNFLTNPESLKEVVPLLKKRGKKVYLSTPVVPQGSDFKTIFKLLEVGTQLEIDAIEIHDVGVLRVAQDYPLKFHLGVFANVYNKMAASKLQSFGVKRVVPSQELTLEEIRELKTVSGLEIELPVQGKLPLGMANACLLSMKFPSREQLPCEQTCLEEHFLKFNGWRIATKGMATFAGVDLSMIQHLPLLLEDGYRYFRIEGLWETPEKLSKLGQIYRQALKEIFENRFDSERNLQKVRQIVGEICNGWYFGHSGREYITSINPKP